MHQRSTRAGSPLQIGVSGLERGRRGGGGVAGEGNAPGVTGIGDLVFCTWHMDALPASDVKDIKKGQTHVPYQNKLQQQIFKTDCW